MILRMYQITVEQHFAASHAIRLPDGSLEPLHGHNWRVRVTVGSEGLDEMETVMDFHDLDALLAAIIKPLGNAHLNDLPPFAGPEGQLAVNPTAERVAWFIGDTLAGRLSQRVTLVRVDVEEALGCWASYQP